MGERSGGREGGGEGEVEVPRLVAMTSYGSKSNCGLIISQFNFIPSLIPLFCDSPGLSSSLEQEVIGG